MRIAKYFLAIFVTLTTLCSLNGCGGGGTTNQIGSTPGTPSSISAASCTPNPMVTGKTASCSATVICTGTGTCSQSVSWSVPTGDGSFTGSTYTAPATANSYTLTVTASGYSTVNATVAMKVVTIAVSPATVSLVAGENQQFQLLENGVAVNATWSLTGSNTINSSGLYSATVIGTSVVTGTDANGSAATATVTVTAPPVSVSASCSPASVPQGQTSTCAASVLNTTNTAVTWTASAGTITSAGVLSVPMSVSAGTIVTVTATSVADTTKSANAQVTVMERQIVIAWSGTGDPNTDPNLLLSPITLPHAAQPEGVAVFDVTIAGAQAGDIATGIDPLGSATHTITAKDVTNGYFEMAFAICDYGCGEKSGFLDGLVVTAAYAPHFIKVWVASVDGTIQSNTFWIPFTTDQQTMIPSKDGTTAYFAPGYPFAVQKYALADGTNKGTVMGDDNLSIAIDDQTGDLLTNGVVIPYAWGTTVYYTSTLENSTTTNVLSINNSTSDFLMAIATKSGSGYATDTIAGKLDKIDLSQMAVVDSVAAGAYAWTMDTATVNGSDLIATYSAEDTAIRFSDKNLNLISSLTLTGVTPAGTIWQTEYTTGGWPFRLFKSGTAVLLSSHDKQLIETALDSSQTLHVAEQTTLTGNPIGIAKDETHQAVIVWYAGTATGKTTLESFDLATLTGTTIASSNSLPIGFEASGVLVSNDGTKLYVGGIDATGNPAFFILANQ